MSGSTDCAPYIAFKRSGQVMAYATNMTFILRPSPK